LVVWRSGVPADFVSNYIAFLKAEENSLKKKEKKK
jgi:hypothetical protein